MHVEECGLFRPPQDVVRVGKVGIEWIAAYGEVGIGSRTGNDKQDEWKNRFLHGSSGMIRAPWIDRARTVPSGVEHPDGRISLSSRSLQCEFVNQGSNFVSNPAWNP
jgi:hypothetical protein